MHLLIQHIYLLKEHKNLLIKGIFINTTYILINEAYRQINNRYIY